MVYVDGAIGRWLLCCVGLVDRCCGGRFGLRLVMMVKLTVASEFFRTFLLTGW